MGDNTFLIKIQFYYNYLKLYIHKTYIHIYFIIFFLNFLKKYFLK